MSITPSDLLLGRKPELNLKHWEETEQEEPFDLAQKKVQQVLNRTEEWWSKWQNEVFPLLATKKKWQVPQDNVQEGDIVLVKTDMKFAKHKFRLSRVVETKKDQHGRVRTVTVAQRNLRKAARENLNKCKAGQLSTIVPVQRIAIILPANEIWNGDLPSFNL